MCLYMETRNFVLLLTSQYSTPALLPRSTTCEDQSCRGPVAVECLFVCSEKTFRAYCRPAVGSKTCVIKIDFDNKFI